MARIVSPKKIRFTCPYVLNISVGPLLFPNPILFFFLMSQAFSEGSSTLIQQASLENQLSARRVLNTGKYKMEWVIQLASVQWGRDCEAKLQNFVISDDRTVRKELSRFFFNRGLTNKIKQVNANCSLQRVLTVVCILYPAPKTSYITFPAPLRSSAIHPHTPPSKQSDFYHYWLVLLILKFHLK